jgi:hypothetical protein
MEAQIEICSGAKSDIDKLSLGTAREEVALDALKEALNNGTLSPKYLARLEVILASAEAKNIRNSLQHMPLASLARPIAKEYQDIRKGYGPHQAIDYSVIIDREIKCSELLVALLGDKDASTLMSGWHPRVDFTANVPTEIQVTLYQESNNKARNRAQAHKNDTTTQLEDFQNSGLQFADDLQAMIVCATLVNKAKVVGLNLGSETSVWHKEHLKALGQLAPLEIELLIKLRDGFIRTASAALGIDIFGQIRASQFSAYSDKSTWAFGAQASAK